jgi:hypothetical protein
MEQYANHSGALKLLRELLAPRHFFPVRDLSYGQSVIWRLQDNALIEPIHVISAGWELAAMCPTWRLHVHVKCAPSTSDLRFITRRESRSEPTGEDHLPNKPVIHPEHGPEAIHIPPAPDATASTVTARAPAQVVVRTVIVRLMSNCLRKPILKPCTQLRYLTPIENPLPYGCG